MLILFDGWGVLNFFKGDTRVFYRTFGIILFDLKFGVLHEAASGGKIDHVVIAPPTSIFFAISDKLI